ncbi:hypothetical protein AAH991_08765 [Microbispora sp. ZYX-F-249]|uniref:Uncharacterized protein n=1 Tax=Microbispora maris TaxID=3144104 RepID=A0ABV0AN64_9ACTN
MIPVDNGRLLPAPNRGGRPEKHALLSMYPGTPVRYVFAGAGFAGTLVDWTQRVLRTVLHIVRNAA